VASRRTRGNQCQRPAGLLGRFVLWNMNSRHSKVTDWGLSHISIDKHSTILDVGCGGGRTVNKLAAIASEGKVYGVDFSKESVAFASRLNKQWINTGRVEIREASVSQLPFSADVFNVVTAVETHFWWPDLPSDNARSFESIEARWRAHYYCGSLQRSEHGDSKARREIRSIIRYEAPDGE
jgi:SAM-dependent methyltransferase